MSSAAVLAVYSAGYVRTRAAADKFAQLEDAGRVRPKPDAPTPAVAASAPAAAMAGKPAAPIAPAAPAAAAPAVAASAPAAAMAGKPAAPIAPAAPVAPVAPIAVAPIAPVVVASVEPQKTGYKDGTYLGWGHCRHGDIQAQVVIVDGRIASATIATCLTRYSCNVIEKLPPQVAQRQSPDVDTISGATQSGDAFYYAVLDALYLAK